MLNDWIYNHSIWASSGVFILAGLIVSGVLVAVMTRLVGGQPDPADQPLNRSAA